MLPTHKTALGMEFSVHEPPKSLKRELKLVFPGVDVEDLVIIPTCQHAIHDLVQMGQEIEQEKDRLLEVVISFFEGLSFFQLSTIVCTICE